MKFVSDAEKKKQTKTKIGLNVILVKRGGIQNVPVLVKKTLLNIQNTI